MPRRAESVQTFSNHRDQILNDGHNYHNFDSHAYLGNYYANAARVTSSSALSSNSPIPSPRLNTSRLNKNQNTSILTESTPRPTQLIVEQVQKFDNRRTPNDLSNSYNQRKSATLCNEVKGMTIGKMMMMSNGERTKLVENKIQDR